MVCVCVEGVRACVEGVFVCVQGVSAGTNNSADCPEASSVRGLTVLVYEALSYWCLRLSAASL